MAARKAAKRASRKSAPRPSKKSVGKRSVARKPSAKGAATAKRASPAKKPAEAFAFGRAGTAGKAEGDAPVRAYYEALPAEHRAIGERVDGVIAGVVPDVRRAVKWSMPMYGASSGGWFCSFASFKGYCAVRFFAGASLDPAPPEGGGKGMRAVKYRAEGDVDEAQLRAWVRQAASLPGWGS